MDLAITQKSGALQPGNQAEYARLVAVFEVILEADQVVRVGAQVLLPELHDGVGPLAGPWIVKANWLHGPVTQGVAPATCDLFDGQTPFKVVQVLPVVA